MAPKAGDKAVWATLINAGFTPLFVTAARAFWEDLWLSQFVKGMRDEARTLQAQKAPASPGGASDTPVLPRAQARQFTATVTPPSLGLFLWES
jgi:hypothetical protein